jgi:hypothetical protein
MIVADCLPDALFSEGEVRRILRCYRCRLLSVFRIIGTNIALHQLSLRVYRVGRPIGKFVRAPAAPPHVIFSHSHRITSIEVLNIYSRT